MLTSEGLSKIMSGSTPISRQCSSQSGAWLVVKAALPNVLPMANNTVPSYRIPMIQTHQEACALDMAYFLPRDATRGNQ